MPNNPSKSFDNPDNFYFCCIFPIFLLAENVLACGEGEILNPVVEVMSVPMLIKTLEFLLSLLQDNEYQYSAN